MFRKKKHKVIPTFVCPHCGTTIPATSRACPECGSDNETGWSEKWYPPGAPYEEEDEAVSRKKRVIRKIMKVGFSLVAALTLAAFIAVEIPSYGIYIGLAVMLAVIVALIVFRERSPSKKKYEKALERELAAMTGCDVALVERLVEYERTRMPGATRAELLERAIDRLERDRSR